MLRKELIFTVEHVYSTQFDYNLREIEMPEFKRNIDDLRATADMTDNAIVLVSGFHQFNDGGGGWFVYRAGAKDELVPGFVETGYEGLGRWIRIDFGSAINIKWFGAVGDGSYDCAKAFDWAAKVASGIIGSYSQGKTVLFPTGTYRFAKGPSPIGVGITLEGEGSYGSGRPGTRLLVDYKDDSDEGGFLRLIDSQSMGLPGGNLNSGGGIRNLTIKVKKKSGFRSNLINFRTDVGYISYWHAENLVLSGNGSAIRAVFARDYSKTGNLQIRDIKFSSIYFAGFSKPRSTVVLSDVANAFFTGGWFFPAKAKGVKQGIWLTGSTKGCSHVRITGTANPNVTAIKVANWCIDGRRKKDVSR